ncbi:MAG: hypothetical protein PVH88_06790 [Ignavibacteria bacterium]|jgi:tetratricopeptide (TPR) repeat protein
MRVLLFVLLLFLPFNHLYQQNLDSLITKGLKESYNFNFESAEKIFDEIIEDNLDLPHGYFYLSQLNLWFYIGSNDSLYLKTFDDYFQKTQELCERQIEIDGNEQEAEYYLGSANVLKSLSLIYTGEYWQAFRAADKGVSFLKDCIINEDPEFTDAYFGIGITGYTFSFVPSFYRYLIGLFGVPSDKEEAIGFLQRTAEKGKFTKLESRFYLSKMLNDYSADYEESLKILKKLSGEFGGNLLIKYQLAVTNIHLNNYNDAEVNLSEIIKIDNKRFTQTKALSYMLMGDILFGRNDFKNSIDYYKSFIENTKSLEYSGYVNFQMALCYAMLQNEIEAKKHLLLGRIGNHDIDEDVYAKAKCEYFFQNGFNKNILLLTQAENYLKVGEIEEAKKLLGNVKKSLTSSIEKNYSNYLFAELNFREKNYGRALDYLQKIIETDLKIFNWIIPKSFLLRSKCYLKLKQYNRAKEILDETESRNEFEYERVIQSRIVKLRETLQKK